MTMAKKIGFLILYVFFSKILYAQFIEDDYVKKDTTKTIAQKLTQENKDLKDNSPGSKWDDFFYGGNIYFQFGTLASFSISGTLGYKFTPELRLGFDFTYQYANNSRFSPPRVLDIIGVRIFGEYVLNPTIFPHIEYEILDLKIRQDNRLLVSRIFTAFLAGAAYNLPINDFFSFQFMVLYNFNWDENQSIYSSPFVTRINVRYNF